MKAQMHKIRSLQMWPTCRIQIATVSALVLGVWAGFWSTGFCDELPGPKQKSPTFEQEVQAIVKVHCLRCHGLESRQDGLDLRSPSLMLRGGAHGPVLVPGSARLSLIYQKVASRSMPPKGEPPLTRAEIESIRLWIDAGALEGQPAAAYYEAEARPITAEERDFWSFRKLDRPTLPTVKHMSAIASPMDTLVPMDALVIEQLEAKGLMLSKRADPSVLMRRAYFDLIGLPPSPTEVDEFLRDDSEFAWSRLLDRLLASPHFGERWGRHWLDAVGYSEVRGTDYNQELDRKQDYAPGMWLYRQYVIDSLNQDKPYDQFLTEQLAGDELVDWRSLPTLTAEARELLVATSFLRTAPDLTWDSPDNTLITRMGVLNQTLETVANNVLGLSLECARCHTHKFDPITQRDYYRMMAVFTPAMDPHGWLTPHDRDVNRENQVLHAMYDVSLSPPTWFLRRGDHLTPGPTVEPGFLCVLCDDEAEAVRVASEPAGATSGRRLALARWLTSPSGRAGALTARVRVSRVWQQLFGVGLVASSGNFGLQGERPIHPQLLEWLASEFVRNDWQLKPLLKSIMLSAVYQQTSSSQSSSSQPTKDAVDPENQLLARMSVRRLSSEAIRDAMLATSGSLDFAMGGPSADTQVLPSGQVVIPVKNSETFSIHLRRSVYTLARRNFYPTLMGVFDQPSMVAACTCRESSAVVLQSLTLLNDEFVMEQADAFAGRVLREANESSEARIRHAWRLALAREPNREELQSSSRLLQQQSDRFRKAVANSETLDSSSKVNAADQIVSRQALACLCHVLFNTSEFIYVE